MDEADRAALYGRGLDAIFDPELRASIGRLIDDVRTRGDDAVCDALERFDGVSVEPAELRVTADEIEAASVSAEVDAAIDDAIAHIRAFSEHQLARLTDWSFEAEPGLIVGEKLTPVDSVGLFVPSGKASYPSVAYQLATPATMAGVAQIVLVVPPIPGRDDAAVDPAVLVVCRKLGVTDVFRVNGPAGVAAMGFGTESIPQVRMIVGPGSPAVTLAQIEMQRYGVTTMMLLGPTESVVIADGTADPTRLAADLLIEAEHGTDSTVVLLTPDEAMGAAVDAELAAQLAELPDVRATAARAALGVNGGCVLTADLDEAVAIANRIAPEHLQVAVDGAVESAHGRRPRQRRRDPRRSGHPVQCRQLRHRLPGLAADVRLCPRVVRDHGDDVPQAHCRRPRRRHGARADGAVDPRPRRPRGFPGPRRGDPPPDADLGSCWCESAVASEVPTDRHVSARVVGTSTRTRSAPPRSASPPLRRASGRERRRGDAPTRCESSS